MSLQTYFRDDVSQLKTAAAGRLYPGLVFDTALPQSWVDEMHERGFDAVPHFVWGYPDGPISGNPYPITYEGMKMLTIIGGSI